MQNDTIERLIRQLSASLSFQINPLSEQATDQEKISRLDAFGFSPAEIAMILGSTNDKVSKQLYVIRRKKNDR